MSILKKHNMYSDENENSINIGGEGSNTEYDSDIRSLF
mgnify:CR=1 FL=1